MGPSAQNGVGISGSKGSSSDSHCKVPSAYVGPSIHGHPLDSPTGRVQYVRSSQFLLCQKLAVVGLITRRPDSSLVLPGYLGSKGGPSESCLVCPIVMALCTSLPHQAGAGL